MKSILKLPLAGCLRIAANGEALRSGGFETPQLQYSTTVQ